MVTWDTKGSVRWGEMGATVENRERPNVERAGSSKAQGQDGGSGTAVVGKAHCEGHWEVTNGWGGRCEIRGNRRECEGSSGEGDGKSTMSVVDQLGAIEANSEGSRASIAFEWEIRTYSG